jgi:hypothetical protein
MNTYLANIIDAANECNYITDRELSAGKTSLISSILPAKAEVICPHYENTMFKTTLRNYFALITLLHNPFLRIQARSRHIVTIVGLR